MINSYYFSEESSFFEGLEISDSLKKMISLVTDYLKDQWDYPISEFFQVAGMTPDQAKVFLESLSPETLEDQIDEVIDQEIYASQRAFAVSLAEYNRSL